MSAYANSCLLCFRPSFHKCLQICPLAIGMLFYSFNYRNNGEFRLDVRVGVF